MEETYLLIEGNNEGEQLVAEREFERKIKM